MDTRVISLELGPKVACVRKRAAAAGAVVDRVLSALRPPLTGLEGPSEFDDASVPEPLPPQALNSDARKIAPKLHSGRFAEARRNEIV